ncbi:hypothetical protein JOD60_002944 [Microbacterium aurum]|nr:hypothetical protein [Microbacterium aurum]
MPPSESQWRTGRVVMFDPVDVTVFGKLARNLQRTLAGHPHPGVAV